MALGNFHAKSLPINSTAVIKFSIQQNMSAPTRALAQTISDNPPIVIHPALCPLDFIYRDLPSICPKTPP